jgi:hypothetical protein
VIRIDGNKLDALNASIDHTIHCVTTATADTDYTDSGVKIISHSDIKIVICHSSELPSRILSAI